MLGLSGRVLSKGAGKEPNADEMCGVGGKQGLLATGRKINPMSQKQGQNLGKPKIRVSKTTKLSKKKREIQTTDRLYEKYKREKKKS